MKYIIANWKAHKNIHESYDWVKQFIDQVKQSEKVTSSLLNDSVHIIVCPPLHCIHLLKQSLSAIKNVSVGAQDISQYPEGSYTGEVSATMLKQLINFSIIGHSERRNNFNETEESITEKIKQLNENHIQSILCVRDNSDVVHPSASFIAYEPITAIGTGRNVNAEGIIKIKNTLQLSAEQKYIYGGSVTPENCEEYLKAKEIDGVLIGKSSLDPKVLVDIVSKI